VRRKIPNTFVLMESTRYDLKFLKVASVTLVLLYLVIIAGSIVRATGSGMGCPDWPKCFGYYIPPTNPAQIEFQESHEYKKSMMIIVKDTLWLSKADFTSAKKFDYSNWEKYPVHNYAKFFVMQTWVEYVNRLIGAVNAFALLALLDYFFCISCRHVCNGFCNMAGSSCSSY
jgi:heme a synthase